ncbi:unnamed protein product [Camellia sinensis]
MDYERNVCFESQTFYIFLVSGDVLNF